MLLLTTRNRRNNVNQTKLEELVGKAATELSIAESSPLMYLGDKLGLYRALAGAGPLTSQEAGGQDGHP